MSEQNEKGENSEYKIDLDALFAVEHQVMGQSRCSSCAAWEDKPHPLRGITVKLKEVITENGKVQMCQVCSVRSQIQLPKRKENTGNNLMKFLFNKQ